MDAELVYLTRFDFNTPWDECWFSLPSTLPDALSKPKHLIKKLTLIFKEKNIFYFKKNLT